MRIKFFFLSVFLLIILFSFTNKVLAQNSDEESFSLIKEAIESEQQVITEYNEFSSSTENVTPQIFQSRIDTWKETIIRAGDTYRRFLNDGNSSIRDLASLAQQTNFHGQNAMQNYQMAMRADSEPNYLSNLDAGDASMAVYFAEMNKTVDFYNSVSGANDTVATKSFYEWGTLLSGCISFVIWLKSRATSSVLAEIMKAQIYQSLFKSSLWMFLGFLITFLGFMFTPPGGRYYVLYGPMLFGTFYFLKGLYVYYFTTRTSLKHLAKNEKYEIYKKNFEDLDNDK